MTERELIPSMCEAAYRASLKISEIYRGEYRVDYKSDESPVTSADLASEKIILPLLREAYPASSVLSEESEDSEERLTNENGVFIVDPLDGTVEFVNRTGEFSVSVGFSRGHRVTAGVIAVPEKELLYYAAEGLGAYKLTFGEYRLGFSFGDGQRIHVSDRSDGVVLAVSRSYKTAESDALINNNRAKIGEILTVGSCYKGCLIAEGRADVHYRFGAKTKEWDTAAMQCIVTEAGGIFTDLDGREITANRADFVNRRGFIILNRRESALII